MYPSENANTIQEKRTCERFYGCWLSSTPITILKGITAPNLEFNWTLCFSFNFITFRHLLRLTSKLVSIWNSKAVVRTPTYMYHEFVFYLHLSFSVFQFNVFMCVCSLSTIAVNCAFVNTLTLRRVLSMSGSKRYSNI